MSTFYRRMTCWLSAATALLLLSACTVSTTAPAAPSTTNEPPALTAANLADGEALRVVATTNIIADVVAQVGGDSIELTSLLPAGADPHSYTLTPRDLRTMNEANAIFVNGLGLEERMESTLESLDGDAQIVSVNQAVETIELAGEEHEEEHEEDEDHEEHEQGEEHEHHHDGADPHTWMSVRNVETWVGTIVDALSTLDPANAESYAANGASYTEALTALESEIDKTIATLPADQRKLVTDHDSFGYFAHEHGFEIIGTVIPSFSTGSEPSAQHIADLSEQIQAQGVPAIFVGTTVSDQLDQQIAGDTGAQVVRLYTGSFSDADGPAATYVEFMRYNVNAIVSALRS